MRHRIPILLIVLSILLLACRSDGLGLKVTFDRIDGLEAGAPVRLQGNTVGRVEKVVFTKAGTYEVDLYVEEAFVNACTSNARFRILPQESGSQVMVVILIPGRPGGTPLAEGSRVKGDGMTPSVALGITADLFKGLEKLGEQIEAFTREFQDVEENQAYQRLKEELGTLGDTMVDAGRSAREKIEKDVLPRIEEELRILRERLEKLGKEAEIQPLEEELERIRKAV